MLLTQHDVLFSSHVLKQRSQPSFFHNFWLHSVYTCSCECNDVS